jgi:hypothetical protein
MPITSPDLKLLAAARMTDTTDGGGEMTGVVLQDGLENNVFPDISSTDRAFGRTQFRKVYAAVLQATGSDILLGANVIIQAGSADTDVSEFGLLSSGPTEEVSDVRSRLERSHWELAPLPAGGNFYGHTAYNTTTKVWKITRLNGVDPAVDMVVHTSHFVVSAYEYHGPFRMATVVADGAGAWDVTFSPNPPRNSAAMEFRNSLPSLTSPRLSCTRDVPAGLSSGATYCDVDTLLVQVSPQRTGTAPGNPLQTGIDGTRIDVEGQAVGMRAGDGLVVHHTDTVAAATYANGNTINAGRTDLAGVRLVGADGLGITTGWTANLAAGTVSVTNITGWSQPVVVHHTIEEVVAISRTGYSEWNGGAYDGASDSVAGPFTLSGGLTMYCGRSNIGRVQVISRTGQEVKNPTYGTSLFTVDLAAGTVTWVGGGDVSASIASYSPVTLVASGTYVISSTASLPQVTPSRITFNRPLTRAFPSGTKVSNMLFLGDLQAQPGNVWSQTTWTEVWADAVIGASPVGQYSDTTAPIVVSNLGTVTERWAIIFLTSTTFRVIGQAAGQVTTGNTASTTAPTNPATGAPYFTLLGAGWGTGWAAGNVLRFNTRGPSAAVWAARVTLPSAPNTTPDSILLAFRGDINA